LHCLARYFVAEDLVVWARSESNGYTVNYAVSGTGMMKGEINAGYSGFGSFTVDFSQRKERSCEYLFRFDRAWPQVLLHTIVKYMK
jgi:hypothetical protein